MTILRFTLLCLSLLSCGTASAASWKSVLNKRSIEIDLPKTWTAVPGIFGLELAFVGPFVQGSRASLSIVDLELDGVELDFKSLKAKQDEYIEGRKKWLDRKKGQLISVFPAEKIGWGSAAVNGIQIGVRYSFGDAEFVERSYSLSCAGRLYHVKTLMRSSIENDYAAEAMKIVRSFSCGQPSRK